MPKKILVKENSILTFFRDFFRAKSKGEEKQWINSLKKQDPELADIWTKYNSSLDNSVMTQYKILKKRGLSTKHIEPLMKNMS